VDIDILAAGAWSLSGAVADGLADGVPLDSLRFSAEPALETYDIALNSHRDSGGAWKPEA
jgi:hypothetical protein